MGFMTWFAIGISGLAYSMNKLNSRYIASSFAYGCGPTQAVDQCRGDRFRAHDPHRVVMRLFGLSTAYTDGDVDL